jgi:hypothetical protein
MRIHCLYKEIVQVYAIENSQEITDMTHNLLVENFIKDRTSSSMISRCRRKNFKWQALEANQLFNKLGLQ